MPTKPVAPKLRSLNENLWSKLPRGVNVALSISMPVEKGPPRSNESANIATENPQATASMRQAIERFKGSVQGVEYGKLKKQVLAAKQRWDKNKGIRKNSSLKESYKEKQ